MKKPRLSKNKNYVQSIFTPRNPQKYRGSLPIIFRSKLELKAFKWMDNNPKVTSWGSESVIIPYKSPIDSRVHRYFVDLVAHLVDKNNETKKLLIEIKPLKFISPPVITSRKSKKTILFEQTQWIINQAKWEAANAWCKKNGYIFLLINERDLYKESKD